MLSHSIFLRILKRVLSLQGADLLQAAELRDELGEGSDNESSSDGGDSDSGIDDSGDEGLEEGLSDVEEDEGEEDSGSDEESIEEGSKEDMEMDGSASEGATGGSGDEGTERSAAASDLGTEPPVVANRKRSRAAAAVDDGEGADVDAEEGVSAGGDGSEVEEDGGEIDSGDKWGDFLPPPPTKRRRAASPKGSSGRWDFGRPISEGSVQGQWSHFWQVSTKHADVSPECHTCIPYISEG